MNEFDRRDILLDCILVFLSVSMVLGGLKVGLRTGAIPSESQYPKVRICDAGRQADIATGQTNNHRWGVSPALRLDRRSESAGDREEVIHGRLGYLYPQ